MKALILAAGEGKRARGVSPDMLKCLHPIMNDKGTLEHLIFSLSSAGFQDFSIVGGYKFKQLEQALNHFNIPSIKTELIDARTQWSKGPLFSFLSATHSMKKDLSSNHILLLAGDTVYSPEFLKFLKTCCDHIEQSKFVDKGAGINLLNSCLMFHSPFRESIPSSIIRLSIKSKLEFMVGDSLFKHVHNLQTIINQDHLENLENKPEHGWMISALIIPKSLFSLAKHGSEQGKNKVIDILISNCGDAVDCWSCEFNTISNGLPIYLDFDSKEDIPLLKKMFY